MAINFKSASKIELQAEYDRIAKEIGDDQFFTKKELHHLPEVLSDNEQVLAFTSGLMDNNTWLITLTNKRIIFLDKGMIYGLTQVSIDLDKINSVSGQTGLIFGKIMITDGATHRIIENVWKKTVTAFTNKVQKAIEANKNQSNQAPSSSNNTFEQLEKLAAMKEKGILSAEEFDLAKKKILAAS